MTTITVSTTIGVDLNPASYTSPVVIEPGVAISNPSYPYAIYRHSGATTVFAIQNSGLIDGENIGIYLAPGGSVTNAVSASIGGGVDAIKISGGVGTVVNNGSILNGNGPDIGVELNAGGSVTNALSASIKGYQGVAIYGGTGIVNNGGVVSGGSDGIALGAGGTVVNSGTVSSGYGVLLDAGGSVTNTTAGYIGTGYSVGIAIRAKSGTVVNDGRIVGDHRAAVMATILLSDGGSVSNSGQIYGATAVSISGTGILNNDGTIKGDVSLASGGTVTNTTGGFFEGNYIHISGAAGTLVNGGTILGGVVLASGGSVTNAVSASIANGYRLGIGISGTAVTVFNQGVVRGELAGISLGSGGSITNAASGYVYGNVAISISGGAGTLINNGTIAGPNYGVGLYVGGSVVNAASASIAELRIGGAAGTVTNAGSINGVKLHAGGIVTNAAAASIKHIQITGSGTMFNDGIVGGVSLISGGTDINSGSASIMYNNGIQIGGGIGTVLNAANATITGIAGYGVAELNGGTLTNAGTIIGNSGAVDFGGTGSNLLVLDPGFDFSGVVAGGTSASNTLELARAASAGTVAGLGTEFVHFGAIKFDAAAQWSISGLQRGLAGTISGFAAGDTIVMNGVTATGSSFAGGILTLDQSGSAPATLDLPGTFTAATDFHVATVPGGTEVTVACFAAGTRILTASGEIAVEELRIGDRVVTLCGRRLAPIAWLGHRRVNCVGHPRPRDVWPVCVKANAIADGVPHRDLWLSPEHAMLFRDDGVEVLVPVRHLLNGTTIIQVPRETITYWHVELASHDAIVAEGLPAETNLDTGNRADFANGSPAVTVHPAFAHTVWHASACAPQLRYGEALGALQWRLAIRAAKAGDKSPNRSASERLFIKQQHRRVRIIG